MALSLPFSHKALRIACMVSDNLSSNSLEFGTVYDEPVSRGAFSQRPLLSPRPTLNILICVGRPGQIREAQRAFARLLPAAEEAPRMMQRIQRDTRSRKLAEETLARLGAQVGVPPSPCIFIFRTFRTCKYSTALKEQD